MKPKFILLPVMLSLAALASAQELRKIVSLTTSSEIREVEACGETGLAAALGVDGAMTVWRLPSGEAVLKRAPEQGIRTIACSADAKWLALGKQDGTVVIADNSGAPVRTLNVSDAAIVGMAFSADNSVLAVQVRGLPAQLWNPFEGSLIAALSTDFSSCGDMAFSPDGTLFATADLDTAVRIYDHAGKLKAKYSGLLLEPFTLGFMPNGKQLVVAGADGTLTILETSDGHMVRALPKQPDPVSALAVLAGGNEIVSIHMDAGGSHGVTTVPGDLRNNTHRELPVDGSQIKGFGVLQNGPSVLFTADSKSSLSVWALPN